MKKPAAMKKLLFVALLSLAGVGLTSGQASAWLFCHHCCSGSATLCIKPYNAFSPSCFGTIACDGCFPVNFGNHGPCGPYGPCGAGGCGAGGPACGGGWCGPSCGPACGPAMGAVMDGSCGSCGAGLAGAPNFQLPPGAQLSGPPTTLPPVQSQPVQTQTGPTFQAPPPSPMPSGPSAPNAGAMARPYYPVQATGYYGYPQQYAPQGYNPYAAMPWTQPMNYPGYWNMQGGR
jgi:hypothetical protein